MILFDIGALTLFEMNYDQSNIITHTFKNLLTDIKLNGFPKKIVISHIYVLNIDYTDNT